MAGGAADSPEYQGLYRAYKIVAFMRWVTLVLGPMAFGWDQLLAERLAQYLPDIDLITFEDLAVDLVQPILAAVIPDLDIRIYLPPVQLTATGLFFVFVVWTQRMKSRVRKAARDVVAQREMMTYGDELMY